MCRYHYQDRWFKDHYLPVPRTSIQDRFWAKVDRCGPDDCWTWMGAKSNGYGAFQMKAADGAFSSHAAHRVAYFLQNGDIPDGAHLHHTCGNRGCVNPAHLEPIMPKAHTVKTWVDTLRSIGYTVSEPEHV